MGRNSSPQERLGNLWLAEAERFEYDQGDWDTVACAELPEKFSHHKIAAEKDVNYENERDEWTEFIYQHSLMLPLEQSCHEGVLLPTSQRAIRLESCPEILLKKLRWFLEECPSHVKSRMAMEFSLLVRIDRARRTGNPDWRPTTSLPAPETDRAFFRPPKLTVRNYGR